VCVQFLSVVAVIILTDQSLIILIDQSNTANQW